MNPALKLLLVFMIAFEISFLTNIWLNLFLIVAALTYLFWHRVHFKTIAIFSLIAFVPAVGIFLSQLYYGSHGLYMGTVLFTRLYAYVYLGLSFSLTTYIVNLSQALEQDFHVPAKFVYGVLAAINLVPRLKYEIQIIRANGNMRGEQLNPWKPTLYFKALLVALQWSGDLSQAMQSQGFVENQPRTFITKVVISKRDLLIFIGILIIVQILAFTI